MKWIAGLALALVAWLIGVALWIAVSPEEDPASNADVAIVLGAAVGNDTPSPVFAARIDHAIDLHRSGRVDRLLFTGARSPEDTPSEYGAAREYAIARGVPPGEIFGEDQSHTTRQNLVNASIAMRANGAASALIVSDPLHLRRAIIMAEDIGIDAEPSATPTTRYRSWSTRLPFLLREVYFIHHYWMFGE